MKYNPNDLKDFIADTENLATVEVSVNQYLDNLIATYGKRNGDKQNGDKLC